MITLAQKYTKAKLIVHSHSGKLIQSYWKTRILDKLGKFLTRKIEYEKVACGENAGKWLFGTKKFLVLNNAMEIEKFRFCEENRKNIRTNFNISPTTKVIGHVGALFPIKNHKFLIKVFYEYQKLETDSKLLLIRGRFFKRKTKKTSTKTENSG